MSANDLSFKTLREANDSRQAEWPGNDQADVPFRTIEAAGKFGEACEAVKKFLRAERGIMGSTASIEDVGDEMADAIIALDLLASQLGIDLGQAVGRKFNRTSEKYSLSSRISDDNLALHPDVINEVDTRSPAEICIDTAAAQAKRALEGAHCCGHSATVIIRSPASQTSSPHCVLVASTMDSEESSAALKGASIAIAGSEEPLF